MCLSTAAECADRASYYWQGQRTANGERFQPDGMTAAHRTLPFGTHLRVTHKRNGTSVTVRVNDRGPFIRGRTIDLSRGAASALGMLSQGVADVSIELVPGAASRSASARADARLSP